MPADGSLYRGKELRPNYGRLDATLHPLALQLTEAVLFTPRPRKVPKVQCLLNSAGASSDVSPPLRNALDGKRDACCQLLRYDS